MTSNYLWTVRLTIVPLLPRLQKTSLVNEFVTAEQNAARHGADQHGQAVASALAHGTCLQATLVRCRCSNTFLFLFCGNSLHSFHLLLLVHSTPLLNCSSDSTNTTLYRVPIYVHASFGKFSFMKMPHFIRHLSSNVSITSMGATR